MGSGCNPTKNLSICLNPISSDCVKYQGEPEPSLGICTGDTITEVEEALIKRVKELTLDGKDITLETLVLSVCSDIEALVGTQSKTVLNVVQALVTYSCILRDRINQINNQLNTSVGTGTVDFKCITAPSQYSITNALNAIVSAHCDLKTAVDQLTTNSGSTTIIDNRISLALNTLIEGIGNYGIKKTVDPSTNIPKYTLVGLVPPYTALPYFGPLSNFDGSGKGIAGVMDGWYLCNGMNGTPDMRGFVPVGAIQGVPGQALDPIVDPSNDASMNYALNQVGGQTKLTITKDNLPNYPIIGSVTGSVNISVWQKNSRHQSSSSKVWSYGPNGTGDNATQVNLAGNVTGSTTVNLGGSGQAIDLRQPYRPCNFIMRFD